jgi:hypothetical protein
VAAGYCESCREDFEYSLVHCGFADSVYAYCDTCGMTALLSMWAKRMPNLPDCPKQQEICPAMEPYLNSCECGGTFKRGSSPRCPRCHQELSADFATNYIEKNAPGTAKGWHWQRSWSGLYSFLIEGKVVRDNFR